LLLIGRDVEGLCNIINDVLDTSLLCDSNEDNVFLFIIAFKIGLYFKIEDIRILEL